MLTSSKDRKIALKIRSISKTFSLGKEKNNSRNCKSHQKTIAALSDINLNIYKGEIIGIIGPNGSGKSTLLKIISEITAPDSGTIEINGKVASILEVGTGFNPDLSGRRNIYLNAILHGMKRKEVDGKFDDIVNLFGFPDFLDTPVKQYSSGMYMRLAFAIIINIEADIYLFDEIFSVGDIKFQKQSLDCIKELSAKNKTVVIVTHSPELIFDFCDQLIVFNRGKTLSNTSPDKAIIDYLKANEIQGSDEIHSINANQLKSLRKTIKYKTDIDFNLTSAKIYNFKQQNTELKSYQNIFLEIDYTFKHNTPIELFVLIRDKNELIITTHMIEIQESTTEMNVNTLIKFDAHTFNNVYITIDLAIRVNDTPLLSYPKILSTHIHNEQSNNKLGHFNISTNTSTVTKEVKLNK